MYSYEKIPEELKKLDRWVLWRKITTEDGKLTKIPVSALNGYGAKSNDSSTWTSFDKALQNIEHYNCNGLGFMLGDGYFGVDLDHCIGQGELVKEFIYSLQSYTEYSQSGEGIHIICKGKLPDGNQRKGNIEMYDNCRFFVMTGNPLVDKPVADCSESVKPLCEKYFSNPKPVTVELKEGQYQFKRESYKSSVISSLSDQEVIDKATNSKSGSLFSQLYQGRWESLYPSQSEADMAFCSMLAFWTQKDTSQMDRIFRTSGLYRDKWDRGREGNTYGLNTIQNAVDRCVETYIPTKTKIQNEMQSNDKVYDLSDTGNAERFVDLYGNDIRYNHENKCWMIWDGKTWIRDPKQLVKNKVDELIVKMKEEAAECEDEKYQSELMRNIKHLSSNNGKEAMLKEAMHIGKTGTINADYDTDKYLLNCENGVVNLKTGELLPHDRNYMMSKNTHIIVDMDNEPQIWKKCMKDIFKGSEELVHYVHKAIGYSLTGDVKEQCFFQCYGNGSNGKSVFFNVIYAMLGDYVVNAQVESVLSRGGSLGSNASPDIARLKGARFVRTNEPNENARFNEGLVKQLTGGDPVTARFLYGGEFEFKPIFKLWIACNYKINVYGTDKGIWRRMRLIPFEACFEGKNDDKDIESKLKTELPQILGWAVKGCIQWQNEGLIPPTEVIEATQTYRTEMDIIEKFSANCLKMSPMSREKGSDVFEEYIKWCVRANEPHKMSQSKFGIEMSKKYQKIKINGYIYYIGIKLVKNDTSYVFEKEK